MFFNHAGIFYTEPTCTSPVYIRPLYVYASNEVGAHICNEYPYLMNWLQLALIKL